MKANALLAAIRNVDQHIIVPVLAEVRTSSIADDNTVLAFDHPPTRTLKRIVDELDRHVRRDPAQYLTFGQRYLAIAAHDAASRIPPEHGIFVWTTRYRFAADGRTLLAAPFVMYRMACDGRLHAFAHRFDPDHDGLSIAELQRAHIRQHLLDSFWFYVDSRES